MACLLWVMCRRRDTDGQYMAAIEVKETLRNERYNKYLGFSTFWTYLGGGYRPLIYL